MLFYFLLFISNNIQSQNGFDSVYCYLTISEQQKQRDDIYAKLFIYNAGKDSVIIDNFNKNIYHESEVYFRADEKRLFFWNLQTLSNKNPECTLIMPFAPDVKVAKIKKKERNMSITVKPNDLYISDIFLHHSSFMVYSKGFYKLCLFYVDNKKCIAETVIEIP
jgi:hypothetical protein